MGYLTRQKGINNINYLVFFNDIESNINKHQASFLINSSVLILTLISYLNIICIIIVYYNGLYFMDKY